jgi:hypothetical protein
MADLEARTTRLSFGPGGITEFTTVLEPWVGRTS